MKPKAPLPPKLDSLRGGSLREVIERSGLAEDLECVDEDLVGLNIDLAEIIGCRVTTTSFADGAWRKPEWVNLALDQCDLANMSCFEASWRRLHLAHTRLLGVQLAGSTIEDVTFDGCIGDLVNLRQAKVSRVVFRDCQIPTVDFAEARLADVRFINCDLTGAQFSNARLQRVHFEGCVLDDLAGLSSLSGATIAGADPVQLAQMFAKELRISLA